jgi:iron-sulfur cluster repair protein YtfE (RIC family)
MPTLALDPTLTLNEITRRHPAALAVLHDHGLDTCCGGALPLAEAARRHGLDAAALRASLERAITGFDETVRAAVEKGDLA